MNAARIILFLLTMLLTCSLSFDTDPQLHSKDNIKVEARKWSKVDGVVHYSGWKPYNAKTVASLKGYQAVSELPQTRYGSDPEKKFKATGFFHTIREGARWWIVDPDGNASWNVAVNGIRPGTSERNEKALNDKFKTTENWINATHKELESFGFNGAACWSETRKVQYSNAHCTSPLSYTLILSLYAGYQKQARKEHSLETPFSVFDPNFESYVDKQAQKLAETRDDHDLLGYFSDNELNFNSGLLDDYLSLKNQQNPPYIVAKQWLEINGITFEKLTDHHREMFLGVVAERYYQVVSAAIRKYDPNHMYLGSRLHSKVKHNRYVVTAAGKYTDILSINYYGHWEPVAKHFDEWNEWADKPVIITEFYTKGDDTGLPNISGAGWRVRTQEDRGIFYENFCLKLLEMKNCVGWHWFRYMDNDPTDTTADESNNDSNKGLVDNYYEYYSPLVNHMKELNTNRYNLIRYFDK